MEKLWPAIGLQNAPKLICVRSTAWGAIQKCLLRHISSMQDAGAYCVFSDVNDRLDPVALEFLDTHMPGKKVGKQVAKAAFDVMEYYLIKGKDWIFRPDSVSDCIAHECICPVYPGYIFQQRMGGEQFKVQSQCGIGPGKQPWWTHSYQDLTNEPEDNIAMPLMMTVAGLTCTDYTFLGQQHRDAGQSSRHHSVWVADRIAAASNCLEDVYISEFAAKYPAQAKQRHVAVTHTLVSLVVGPEGVGYPLRRSRCLAAGIANHSYVWVGPPQESIHQDFMDIFGCDLQLTGDVYFVADDNDVKIYSKTLATHRGGVHLVDDAFDGPMASYLHNIVPPGAMLRLAEYSRFREHSHGGQS